MQVLKFLYRGNYFIEDMYFFPLLLDDRIWGEEEALKFQQAFPKGKMACGVLWTWR